MRLAMEGILYEAGVDVVINGHNHAYERSNPVFVSCCLASCMSLCTNVLFAESPRLVAAPPRLLHDTPPHNHAFVSSKPVLVSLCPSFLHESSVSMEQQSNF